MNYVGKLSATRGKTTLRHASRASWVDHEWGRDSKHAPDKRIRTVQMETSDGFGPPRMLTYLTAAGLINGYCSPIKELGPLPTCTCFHFPFLFLLICGPAVRQTAWHLTNKRAYVIS